MKKTLKIAALVAAAVMAMGFVSCANDDAEDLGTLLIVKDYQEKKEAEAKAAAAAAAAATTTTNTNSGSSSSGSSEATTTKYTLTPDKVSSTAYTKLTDITTDGAKFQVGEKVKSANAKDTSTAVINLGGKGQGNGKCSIVFTTTGAATVTVKFCANEASQADRYICYSKALKDAPTGDYGVKCNADTDGKTTATSGEVVTTVINLTDAGTYSLGGSANLGITELTVEM